MVEYAIGEIEIEIGIATLRDLISLQPVTKAELARACGIARPNLIAFLRTGDKAALSRSLRRQLYKQIGMTSHAWLGPDAHVWHGDDVEVVIKVLDQVIPPSVCLEIREVRRKDDWSKDRMALTQIYLISGSIHGEIVRILVQIEATEDKAEYVRAQLKACPLRHDVERDIPTILVQPTEHKRLSQLKAISNDDFDGIGNQGEPVTWTDVLQELTKMSNSPRAVMDIVKAVQASHVVSAIVARRNRKKE